MTRGRAPAGTRPGGALRVGVVGGGVGGLTAALALTRAGVSCHVLESVPRFAAAGGGLQLSPNATRVLHRLGLGPALADVAVRPHVREVLRGDDDTVLARTPLAGACEEAFGAPYCTVRRDALHRLLRAALPSGVVSPGRRAGSGWCDAEHAHVEVADGTRLSFDAVVGADGVGSTLRGCVARGDGTPAPDARGTSTGAVVYRGLVRPERLPEPSREAGVHVWVGPDRHVVAYPVSPDGTVSLAAVTPGARAGHDDTAALRRALLDAFRGWSTRVRALLSAADLAGVWELRDHAGVPRWSAGRLTLLGDAAHPMLPFVAQGANQAIEDAAALAPLLTAGGGDEVPDALRRYEALRRPRTKAVQQAARRPGTARRAEWLYGYDAEREARRVRRVR